MNSSQIQEMFPSGCTIYNYIGGKPDHFSSQAYAVLVTIIISNAATFPFTILLNLLVMIAVKTKAQLQNNSDIALACLASTDVMVGLVVQPLLIALNLALINDDTSSGACSIHVAATLFTNFFCFSSLSHLLLMSGDRYLAINRPYTYNQTVTKARILIASATAWILTVLIHIIFLINQQLLRTISSVFLVSFIVIIAVCNVTLYREARRHEQQIAVNQVPVEAREVFLRQKRALKLTMTIAAFLFISYLPGISLRASKNYLKDIVSIDTLCAFSTAGGALVALNSFVNPLIYCIRKRQFRVAFIQLLLRKNYNQAEEFEEKMFGSNAVANVETNQREESSKKRDINQANAIRDNTTSLRGDMKEHDLIQPNAIRDCNTSQEGEREEQDINQDNAIRDSNISQRRGRHEQDINHAKAVRDSNTSQREERKEQYFILANDIRESNTSQGGEREKQIYHPSQCHTRQ